jgi:hypothetical protein
MPTDPIVDAVGWLSRGGNCRHGGTSLESRAAARQADNRKRSNENS